MEWEVVAGEYYFIDEWHLAEAVRIAFMAVHGTKPLWEATESRFKASLICFWWTFIALLGDFFAY